MPTVAESGKWEICTDRIRYDGNVADLLPGYPSLIRNYRVLIFNGDAGSRAAQSLLPC